MNWVDYIILTILGISVLIGLFRGLISEVLGLVIWAGAFWAAWAFGPSASAWWGRYVSMPEGRAVLGYGSVLMGVLIGGAIVRAIISRILWRTGLSGMDRMLGMVFGFARGSLVVAFMVFMVSLTALTREGWWHQSNLVPQFTGLAGWLGAKVPPGVNRVVAQSGQMLDQVQVPDMQMPNLNMSKGFELPQGMPSDWMEKLKQGGSPFGGSSLIPTPSQPYPVQPYQQQQNQPSGQAPSNVDSAAVPI
ncbi:CvpA family protein [Dyella sp.]|uniref:CvpA family protein n=1 Tax=Dyella sp. TaxID=1869338 RepID=UPI002ED40E9D